MTTALLPDRLPAAASAPADRTVSGLTSTVVFIGRSLRHTLRNTEALTMAVVLPVMLMLLFTYVFGGALDAKGGYVNYVVPGIILLCAGFGSSSTAVDVAEDMTNGIVDRFRTMPLRANGVITGHVVASLVRNLIATGVVIGVALAVGFRPTANPVEWLGALGIIALFILAITWLYAAIGLAARTPSAASSYGFALLFLPYLSSAFVPPETMPSWLQWIADNQPITPIIETIRGLLLGTDSGDRPLWALGWCLVIIVGAYVWAAILFRRKAARR
ncbi:ABC transporter permease [Leifsonia poae]|uniref:ABC transporter permease n=1 Tax=Leifsonia poae TaxID=110933 RepID=UPI001CBE597D|nr:ABC transporter permease [Leifsonia poae]